jgi:hypothetical protein
VPRQETLTTLAGPGAVLRSWSTVLSGARLEGERAIDSLFLLRAWLAVRIVAGLWGVCGPRCAASEPCGRQTSMLNRGEYSTIW